MIHYRGTAKIWQYNIRTDTLKIIAQRGPARFGTYDTDPVEPFSTNEESLTQQMFWEQDNSC